MVTVDFTHLHINFHTYITLLWIQNIIKYNNILNQLKR
jgi:hypothetical protein